MIQRLVHFALHQRSITLALALLHRVVREVQHAAVEVARPLTFAVLIIMTVYVPILTFQRIEGKLFRPMAVSISLAVVGSLILTLTLIPVLTSFFFRRPPSERESPLLRGLRRPYTSAINWCVRHVAEPDVHAASPRMGVREMVDY